MTLTPEQIADAWFGMPDRWFWRVNKQHKDGRACEVVHGWGDADDMEVIERFEQWKQAQDYANHCENMARANAVLKLVKNHQG